MMDGIVQQQCKNRRPARLRVVRQKYNVAIAKERQKPLRPARIVRQPKVYQLGRLYHSKDIPLALRATYQQDIPKSDRFYENDFGTDEFYSSAETELLYQDNNFDDGMDVEGNMSQALTVRDLFGRNLSTVLEWRHVMMRFSMIGVMVLFLMSSFAFVGHVFAVRERVLVSTEQASHALTMAVGALHNADFSYTQTELLSANTALRDAQAEFQTLNKVVVRISQYIPGASKLASGDNLISAGVLLTEAGTHGVAIGEELLALHSNQDGLEGVPFLPIIERVFTHLHAMEELLQDAQTLLDGVRVDDVPDAQKKEFLEIRRFLPNVLVTLEQILSLEDAIYDLAGKKGPRKYLFLFQNNQEVRATGGFIGSYGLMDVADGRMRSFHIDGIYNPDGQLIDKLVPPLPIQKISAAWSLHDSNWWPDFPMSARKAMDFYERTGGPTVDGVIMITPTMVEKMLMLTGPITLDEYDVTLTKESFIEDVQYKVEVDYDKEENRPKKILGDFMPQLVAELFNNLSSERLNGIANIISEGLTERHIMIYATHNTLQDVLSEQKWDGRILGTSQDYLSVINTNINGFKTDGVVAQDIVHNITIDAQGKIIDELTITRTHNGGYTGREWWDAVNANYIRVYVPQGARLLSAKGHTREVNTDRLDYDALGFERDQNVVREESEMSIDPETGTRIYDESGKTVFANWVYVSPQETVRVTYVYELPFTIDFKDDENGRYGAFSTLYQAQAGSTHGTLTSTITLPEKQEIFWMSDHATQTVGAAKLTHELTRDRYHAVVFGKQQ